MRERLSNRGPSSYSTPKSATFCISTCSSETMPTSALKSKLQAPCKKKPAAKYGKKAGVNSAFKRKHALRYGGGKADVISHNTGLRRLVHTAYETIVRLGQEGAKRFLEGAGVCLKEGATKLGADLAFMCWSCGEPFTVSKNIAGEPSIRCNNTSCEVKPRLYRPDVAYTPFFSSASAGQPVDYQMGLRTAYAIGCKLPNESAMPFVKREAETPTTVGHKVNYFYKHHKIAFGVYRGD